MLVQTLGGGYGPAAQSLVTHLVDNADHTGRLYAIIAVMSASGSLVAGPGLSYAFHEGLKWGRAWLGLPFMVCGVLYVLVFIVLVAIRLRHKEEQGEA